MRPRRRTARARRSILVDTSYSMGYGDRWSKAQAAARDAIEGLAAGDRASLVFFSTGADARGPLRGRPRTALAALAAAAVGPGATRFAPALKLGGSLLGESPLPRREIVPDQRLPTPRLGRDARPRRRPAAGSHGADAGRGRRGDDHESVGHAGLARADALREPGPRHRDRRRRQSRRGSRVAACRSRSR